MFMESINPAVAILSGLVLVFCIACVVWMGKMQLYIQNAVRILNNQNKNSVSLRRIAEVEATLTELLDSYDSLLTSHKKLRSRIGMREYRERKANGAESTDTGGEDERAATKEALRIKARQQGHKGL